MYKPKELLLKASAILILLSALGHFVFPAAVPWVMILAVSVFSYAIVSSPYPGKSLRGKRLYNFQLLACALFAATTYLMFLKRNEWVLTLIVGAILLLYASAAIPKENEKEEEEEKKK